MESTNSTAWTFSYGVPDADECGVDDVGGGSPVARAEPLDIQVNAVCMQEM